jgi:pimeloyl-ACP methyl ester carboxylesterase
MIRQQPSSPGRPALRVEEVVLHGHRITVRIGGEGPVLVLVHGIAGTSQTWEEVLPELARNQTVIAPDLLGHGRSAKPRGDYSLGAYASGIRDLLAALGFDRASFAGHSLGGGIAMQLAYQFPQRLERLILISSGGLGRELHPLLRSAAWPGAEYVLPLLCANGVLNAGAAVGEFLGKFGLRAGPDLEEIARGFASLGDTESRQAFIHTVRSVIDAGGQRVDATDRLYLAAEVPTLIVWGERDPLIPAEHGHTAHRHIPGSRLEVFPGAGHFPHRADPRRFVEVISDFVASTEPARLDDASLRKLILEQAEATR